MSTTQHSPVVFGAGSLSLLLCIAAAFALLLGVVSTFSVSNPQVAVDPVYVVVVIGGGLGAGVFGLTACLLALAR